MQNIITAEEAFKLQNTIFIDVRSESEYAEDHLPSAINIPIFNDEERALVGKVYKEVNVEEAKILGLKIASPKLSHMYESILKYKDFNIVVYCWRGGMRSKATHAIMTLLNLRTFRLEGGYKAYRRFVNSYFQENLPLEVTVIHGLTGVGKTELLNIVNKKNINVVDLEALAHNRGSVYGNVALPPQPTQKMFETKLFNELWQMQNEKYVIMECESKRIGRVTLPNSVFNAMKTGKHILLYDSIVNRIKRIIDEYATESQNHDVQEQLLISTKHLQNKLGNKTIEILQQQIKANCLEPVVEYLLTNYYDPLYKYPDHPSEDYDLSVDARSQIDAAQNIIDYIKESYFEK